MPSKNPFTAGQLKTVKTIDDNSKYLTKKLITVYSIFNKSK